MRVGLVIMVVVLVIWGVLQRHRPAGGAQVAPPSIAQLLSSETQLNLAYASGNTRVTWSFFDQATRSALRYERYAEDRRACPLTPVTAETISATSEGRGWWAVVYRESGVSLVDYWHVARGRWVFSLLRSNPRDAVLYRLSPAAYARAVGCVG